MNLHKLDPSINFSHWILSECVCVCVSVCKSQSIWFAFSRSVILSAVIEKECVCWKSAAKLSKQIGFPLCLGPATQVCFNGNLCLNGFTLWFAMWISTRFVDYMNYLAPDCIWHIITFAHRTLNSKSEFFLMQRFGCSLYVCLTFWGLGNTTTEEPPSHRNHSGSGFRQGLRLGAGSCVHIFDRDGATTSCEAI